MKRLLCGALLAMLALGLGGCEFGEDTDKVDDLIFENHSHFTVTVISLSTEWGGFALAPGEFRNLGQVASTDYVFNPDEVVVGGASDERYIVFVDAAKNFE